MAIELDNSFTVPIPPKQAWDVLLDVERIAPCMPGATITGVDGDEITGTVKVKLGPVSLTYKGTARFTEKDEERRYVALEANGKETRGSGTASATVTASLAPGESDGQTVVTMHTSLNVTGKPAQFGRGVMADVSAKLIEQFAANLSDLLATSTPAEPEATAEKPEVTEADTTSETDAASETDATDAAVPEQQSLNIVRLAAGPVLKRIIPVAAVAGAIVLLYRKFLRRSKA
jgi:carbon monoxide dehydrogenase subunit G